MTHPRRRDLRPVGSPETDEPQSGDSQRPTAGIEKSALVTIAVVVIVGALKVAQALLVPIVFALVFALALAPVVRRLQRLMPRWIAAALVVASLVGLLGATSYSLSDETEQAIAGLPQATRTLRQSFRTFVSRGEGALSQLQSAVAELQRTAAESADKPSTQRGVTAVQVVEPPVDFNNFVWLGSQGALAIAGSATLVVFLVYFLLASGDLFKRKFVKLSGDRMSQRKVTVQLIDQICERVAKSMFHLILASALVGVCTWGLLAFFGVHYAALWGLVAALMNCVPYVGPAIVAAALMLATLVQFGSLTTVAIVTGGSLVITALEGFLFTPVVFGRSVQLNPVAVFVSFMFWGWLWGIAGMLLALPLLMIVKTVAESVDDLAPLAELLSD